MSRDTLLTYQQAVLFVGLRYREDLLRVLVQLVPSSMTASTADHVPPAPTPDADFRQLRLAKSAVLARMLRIIYHLPLDALCKCFSL